MVSDTRNAFVRTVEFVFLFVFWLLGCIAAGFLVALPGYYIHHGNMALSVFYVALFTWVYVARTRLSLNRGFGSLVVVTLAVTLLTYAVEKGSYFIEGTGILLYRGGMITGLGFLIESAFAVTTLAALIVTAALCRFVAGLFLYLGFQFPPPPPRRLVSARARSEAPQENGK